MSLYLIRPGLEKALLERDKERAKEIAKRFMPEHYKWIIDWISESSLEGKESSAIRGQS